MAPEKAPPKDPRATQDFAAERGERGGSHAASGNEGTVSDDINRIASYLTETRLASCDRTQGLVTEISNRRAEITAKADRSKAFASRLNELANDLPDRGWGDGGQLQPRAKPLHPNPLLAERLHVFCRELDQLLDSFRARVEYKKQVRH
jgi:hypothetical protein